LLLQGHYYLKDQIDSSHTFLYGHRYWPQVKRAIADHAATWTQTNDSLADQILKIANRVANELKIDVSLVVGITAAGFMTVQQAGLEAFNATAGEVLLDSKHAKKSPEQMLKERAKDDSQGFFGFLLEFHDCKFNSIVPERMFRQRMTTTTILSPWTSLTPRNPCSNDRGEGNEYS